MPNEFNADEIFQMAIKIEQNGAVFYRNAAKNITEDSQKAFLLDLAKMEDDHEATFAKMQEELDKQDKVSTNFDPDNENVLYLKALADSRVFAEKDEPENNLKSILNCAIKTEKDSIAFYLGMKELISDKTGQSKIDDIIKEEMTHIRILGWQII